MEHPNPVARGLLMAGIAVCLGLSACSDRPDDPMENDRAANNAGHSKNMAVAVDDTLITSQIKAKLGADERTDAADIDVHTNNGVVTLTGQASDLDVSQTAELVAKKIPNVVGVDNQIEVPSSVEAMAEATAGSLQEATSDSWITTQVKSAILAKEGTDGTDIQVETEAGVVRLSGIVASKADADHAVEIARGIKGVKQVDASQLKFAEH